MTKPKKTKQVTDKKPKIKLKTFEIVETAVYHVRAKSEVAATKAFRDAKDKQRFFVKVTDRDILVYRKPLPDRARCDDCRKVTLVSNLKAPGHLWERLNPGGEVPAGECKCGALAYLIAPQSKEPMPW